MGKIREKFEFVDIIRLGINYHNVGVYLDTTNGIKFDAYFLSEPLNDEQKASIKKFKNIKVMSSHCEYAPEIKYQVLAVYKKKIK